MRSLFGRGFRGLSDTIFSGVAGSVFRSVGIDSRTEPGVLKAHQKLTKHSGSTIDQLCKVALALSDGSKLWFSSTSGKIWREVSGTYTLIHTLSMINWDILTLGYTGQSLDTTGQSAGAPLGFYNVNGVGIKFFAGRIFSSFVNEYRDTTYTYDLINQAYHSQYNHNTQTADSRAYWMRADGQKWWVASATVIYQYTTGASLAIASSTYDSLSFTPAQTSNIVWFGFNTTGTKLYICGGTTTPVLYQYTLSTAWNVSTATYDSVSFAMSTQVTLLTSMVMTPDGTSVIVEGVAPGASNIRLIQYRLTTAFNIATMTYNRTVAFARTLLTGDGRMFVQQIPAHGIYPATNRLFFGEAKASTPIPQGRLTLSGNIIYEAIVTDTSPSNIVLGAGEIQSTYPGIYKEEFVFADSINDLPNCVVIATNKYAIKIKTSDIASPTDKFIPAGTFTIGSNLKPTIKHNTSLYFGDGNVVAQLDREGIFTPVTNLNVPKDETIKSLSPYDIDILVGTSVGNYGRVLRWDGLADSWIAEDNVFEKEGVEAFIQDDNYTYVVAGRKGAVYYYNGSKCEDFITIPGVDELDTVKVNNNAVGYYLGSPVFGLSNNAGNPVLQGVYGYGSYNSNYSKSLTLDYPLSTNQFSGVEIGAILVDGDDMYVSWQDGTGVGVDKVDWTAKYANAYFETVNLTPSMNRHQAKTVSDVIIPYNLLPASTGITIGVDKDYAGSFDDMDVLVDTKRKNIKLKSPSIPDTVNPRLRVGFTTSANNTPKIEDVIFNIAPVGDK